MTLQNGLLHNGSAFLWTDERLYHPETGAEIGSVAKAFCGTLGQLFPWAAVHSGMIEMQDPGKLARRIGERGYPMKGEELLEAATSALRLEAEEGRVGRLLIAYYDHKDGPFLWHLANDPMPGRAPLEPCEVGAYMSAGNGSAWAEEFTGRELTPADMRALIDWQIETPAETVLGWTGRNIGGNIVEIEVSAAGVDSRVVRAVERSDALVA